MRKQLWANETGASLAITMVTVAVVACSLAIMLSGFGTSGVGTVVIHRRASAQSLVRQQMEAVKAEVYQPNPTAIPYTILPAPTGYTTTLGVTYWVSDTQSFSPTRQAEDDGLQLIDVTVWSTDGEKLLSAQDIKRR